MKIEKLGNTCTNSYSCLTGSEMDAMCFSHTYTPRVVFSCDAL